MATTLGKVLKKMRIDNDELLKDMADKLGIASSTLSSIENGRRNPPKGFLEKMKEVYELNETESEQLDDAFLMSKEEIALDMKGLSSEDQTLAVSFARRFKNLSESDKERIKEILNASN